MTLSFRQHLFLVITIGTILTVIFTISFELDYNLRLQPKLKEAVPHTPETNRRSTVLNGTSSVTEKSCTPLSHLVFIKVHKAGSSTIANILFQFGVSHNLTFALPRKGVIITFWQNSSWDNIMPPPPERSFDILCSHSVYARPELAKLMPSDTVYTAIVREPLSHLHASLHYFYGEKIPGENKLSIYLRSPYQYPGRLLNNSMSYELGLAEKYFYNRKKIDELLDRLDNEFEVILVMERMEESLILLKRAMCWTMEDILFMPKNVNKGRPELKATERERKKHVRLAMADYMLYEFCLQRLQRQILSEGRTFWEELRIYKTMLRNVSNFCNNSTLNRSAILLLQHTEFSDVITIPKIRCDVMVSSFGGLQVLKFAKDYQYPSIEKT